MFKIVSGVPALLLTAALACSAPPAIARTSVTESGMFAPGTHAVSLLNGKIAFTLRGFNVQVDDSRPAGKMYFSQAARRLIFVSEGPMAEPSRVGKDSQMREAAAIIVREQKAMFPNFSLVSETLTSKDGMLIDKLEATDKLTGFDAIKTILLVNAGTQLAVVHVYSHVDDQAQHLAAVRQVLGK
jgi:hypothetical protein